MHEFLPVRVQTLLTLLTAGLVALSVYASTPLTLTVTLCVLTVSTPWVSSRLFRNMQRVKSAQAAKDQAFQDAQDRCAWLEQRLDSLADGLLTTDTECRVTAANPAACRLLGREETEVLGQPVGDVLGLAGGMDKELCDMLHRQGSLEYMETELPKASGAPAQEKTIVQFSSSLLQDDDGASGLVFGLRDITELRRGEQWLMDQAFKDTATGLPNRKSMLQTVDEHLLGAAMDDEAPKGCIIYIDLDRFRRVNVNLGRSEADRVLFALANRLSQTIRSSDMLARVGGDEFVVFMTDVSDRTMAGEAMNRLLDTVAEPLSVGPREHLLTATGGILMLGELSGHQHNAVEAMEAVETAMLRAKDNPDRNWLAYRSSMHTDGERYAELENALLECLEDECLEVVYQPLVEAETGAVTGLEALARLTHPVLGKVPPDEFISLAEEAGLMGPLGRLIRRRAVSEYLSFDVDGSLPNLHLNVSAHELARPDFAAEMLDLLDEYGVPTSLVTVEVAETAVADDPDTVAQVLAVLKNEGLSISLDDYGVGSLSLSSLTRLPLDSVKLHNSLITGAKYRLGSLKLARGLSSLARHLRLSIVAEGVETLDDLEIVHGLRCETYQGFFFAEPAPAKELRALLAELKHFAPSPEECAASTGQTEVWKM